LNCDAGPIVEAEAGADVHVVGPAAQNRPNGVRLNAGAALFDVPQHYPGGFQILTPRTIAAVRGTVWIVDVQPQQTSVFVMRGQVNVRRPNQPREVVLNQGDGVDVGEATGPLVVKHWPAPRVAALLARFGR
jgi:ferric-dicitrate binding protein FerR (iron transport regulator)